MASPQELACIYAALALQDDEIKITGEKIQQMLDAAGITVEPFWPGVYAKALQGVDVKNLLSNIGSGVGAAPASAAPAAAAAPAGGAAPAKEEKKKPVKEESEEEDGDMGFGLFD